MTQLAPVMPQNGAPTAEAGAESRAEGAAINGTPFPELLLRAALGRLPTEANTVEEAPIPEDLPEESVEESPEEAALLAPADAAVETEVALPFRGTATAPGLPEAALPEAASADARGPGAAAEAGRDATLREVPPLETARPDVAATPVPDAASSPSTAELASAEVPRTGAQNAPAPVPAAGEQAPGIRSAAGGAAVDQAAASARPEPDDSGARDDDAARSRNSEPALPEATSGDRRIAEASAYEAARSADRSSSANPPPTAQGQGSPPPVATASFEAIVPATPPTPQPAAAPLPAGSPAEVLPVHAEWLTQRGGGTARLRLHPPELGEMELSVRVRGDAVDVVIRAREPAAQLAAAQSRELLVEGLAQRDLRVEQFDVRADDRDPRGQDAADFRERRDASQGEANDASGRGLRASGDEDARRSQSRLLVTNEATHARRHDTAVDLRA